MTVGASWTPFTHPTPHGLVRKTVNLAAPTLFNGIFDVRVPGHEVWRVIMAFCGLVADATAGNRSFSFRYTIDGGVTLFAPSSIAQAPSTGVNYQGVIGTPANFAAAIQPMWLPDIILGPGMSIGAFDAGVGAGDTITFFRLVYEAYDTSGIDPDSHNNPGQIGAQPQLDDLVETVHALRVSGR